MLYKVTHYTEYVLHGYYQASSEVTGNILTAISC